MTSNTKPPLLFDEVLESLESDLAEILPKHGLLQEHITEVTRYLRDITLGTKWRVPSLEEYVKYLLQKHKIKREYLAKKLGYADRSTIDHKLMNQNSPNSRSLNERDLRLLEKETGEDDLLWLLKGILPPTERRRNGIIRRLAHKKLKKMSTE